MDVHCRVMRALVLHTWQALQTEAPVVIRYVPVGQATHEEVPGDPAYVPTAQAWQAVLPVAVCPMPVAHAKHWVACVEGW